MSSADPRGCTELELASILVLMIKAESPEMWLLVHKKLTMPVLAHLNSSLFEELFMCYSPKVLTGLRTMISLFPLKLPLTSLFKTYYFLYLENHRKENLL